MKRSKTTWMPASRTRTMFTPPWSLMKTAQSSSPGPRKGKPLTMLPTAQQRGLAHRCRGKTGLFVRGPEWPPLRLGWQPLQPSCHSR
uniref:PHD finger protein 2 n=1 Tax=Rousettus aegyptiacus TaxID=9407 RepID=A0A7J8IRG0_ROUAE|nr:PHD finger protein 2 [Rousettus aegyptiacus]